MVGRVSALTQRVTRLRRIIEREAVNVIHTHFLSPCLHAYLARMPSRRWGWVHTEHVRPDVIVDYPKWLLRAAPWIVPAADVVTGVATGVAGYIREHRWAPTERVRVIYNGVDVDLFARASDREAKRHEIGLPASAWAIGIVGNLRPQKNHELALAALVKVLREAPNAWLVIVGEGERRERLEMLARELGVQERTLFLGARTDVPALLSSVDVYCLPSHFEGMPLSLFEAMAARRPIVATSVVGIDDLIVNGTTGLLVPANDAEALSRALLRIRRDSSLRDHLVAAGWRHVNTHARVEGMVGQYGDLYQELARSRVSKHRP